MAEAYQNAWAALRMIREAVETLGPVGALPSEEAVLQMSGPEPLHEAEHIVAGIKAIAARHDARISSLEAALREARGALRPFACLCAEIQSLADANHNSPHEWAKICAWPDLQKAHHAAVAIDAALNQEGGEAAEPGCNPAPHVAQPAQDSGSGRADGWKPIATAPRDGTQILAFVEDFEPQIHVVSYTHTVLPKGHRDYWEGWSFADEILINHCVDEPVPTHWRPLPDPPTDSIKTHGGEE